MTCERPFKLQEGYLKTKLFDITLTKEVEIEDPLPIFTVSGGDIITSVQFKSLPTGLGTMNIGLAKNNGGVISIIPKFLLGKDTATVTLPLDVSKIDTTVKPVGITTQLDVNDIHTILNNILDDSSSVVATDIDKSDEYIRNADTYLIYLHATAKIPINTRIIVYMTYQSTV